MSIGDSLLNYFSESEIKKAQKKTEVYYHKDNKFAEMEFENLEKFKVYDGVRVTWKPNDKNYKLYAITGINNFKDNFNDCIKQQKEVIDSVIDLFPNSKRNDRGKVISIYDKSGKSFFYETYFIVKDQDRVRIYCENWSDKMERENGWWDSLGVVIQGNEFGKFLLTYK